MQFMMMTYFLAEQANIIELSRHQVTQRALISLISELNIMLQRFFYSRIHSGKQHHRSYCQRSEYQRENNP